MSLLKRMIRVSSNGLFCLCSLALLAKSDLTSMVNHSSCHATISTPHNFNDRSTEPLIASRLDAKVMRAEHQPSIFTKRTDDGIFDHLEDFITDWHLVTPPYPHTVVALPGERGEHIPFVSENCPTISTADGPQRSPLCIQVRPTSPHSTHQTASPGATSVDGQRVWDAAGRSAQHRPMAEFQMSQLRGDEPPRELFYDHFFALSGIGWIGRWHWTVPAHKSNELVLELDIYWPEAVYAWQKVRGTTLLDLWINFEVHYYGASVGASRRGQRHITSPPITAMRDSEGRHSSAGHPVSEGSWRFSLVSEGSNTRGRPTSRALIFNTGTHREGMGGDKLRNEAQFVVQWRAVALEMGTANPTNFIYRPTRKNYKYVHPKNPKYYTPEGHKDPANWVPAPDHDHYVPAVHHPIQNRGKRPLHSIEPIPHGNQVNRQGAGADDEIFEQLEPLETLHLIEPPFPRRVNLLPGESSSHAPVVSTSCPSSNDYAHAGPSAPLCLAVDISQSEQVWTSVRNVRRFSVDNWLNSFNPQSSSFSEQRFLLNHPDIGSFGDAVWQWSVEDPGHVRLRTQIDWSQLKSIWTHARNTVLLEFQLEFQVYFAKLSINGKPAAHATISYTDRRPIWPLQTVSSWSGRPENAHSALSGEWRFKEVESLVGHKPYERSLIFDTTTLRDKVENDIQRTSARQIVIVYRIVAKERGQVSLAGSRRIWKRPPTGGPAPPKKGRRPSDGKPSRKRSLSVLTPLPAISEEIAISGKQDISDSPENLHTMVVHRRHHKPGLLALDKRQFDRPSASHEASTSTMMPHRVLPLTGESPTNVPIVSTTCPVTSNTRSAPCILLGRARASAPSVADRNSEHLFESRVVSTPYNFGSWLMEDSQDRLRTRRFAINIPNVGHVGTWVWEWQAHIPLVISVRADINMDDVIRAFQQSRRTTVTSFMINFAAVYYTRTANAERTPIPILLRSDLPNIGPGVALLDPVGAWSTRRTVSHEGNRDLHTSRYLVFDLDNIAQNDRNNRPTFRRISIEFRVEAVELGTVQQMHIHRGPRQRDGSRGFSRDRHQGRLPPRRLRTEESDTPGDLQLQHIENSATVMHELKHTRGGISPISVLKAIQSRANLGKKSFDTIKIGKALSKARLLKRQTRVGEIGSSSAAQFRYINGHEASSDLLRGISASRQSAPPADCTTDSSVPVCVTVLPGSSSARGSPLLGEYVDQHMTRPIMIGDMIMQIPLGEERPLQHRTTLNIPGIGYIGHWVFEWNPILPERIILAAHITEASLNAAWELAYGNRLLNFHLEYRLYFGSTHMAGQPAIRPVTTFNHASDPEHEPWTEFGTWAIRMTDRSDSNIRSLISDDFLVFDRQTLSAMPVRSPGHIRRVRIGWRVLAHTEGIVRRGNIYVGRSSSFWTRYALPQNGRRPARHQLHVPPEYPP